jgi:hypothetical protein
MVGSTVWKGTDSATMLYHCGKSILGQGKSLTELPVTINAQVEAPGHGKWWLVGKTGSDKCYCQQCMCCILMPETAHGGRQMLSAKWIEHKGVTFAVSLADKCICLLSNTACLNGIKSKGMRSKHEGRALVMRNDYMAYTMTDVPLLPNYKVSCQRGSSMASVHTTTSARTRTLAWAGGHCVGVACSCGPCKDQLQRPWMLHGDITVQPRNVVNKDCKL